MTVLLSMVFMALVGPYVTKADEQDPVTADVYGIRHLDEESVIKMSGIDLDSSLSATEVKQRLQTSSLFSDVYVKRDKRSMFILAREKTSWFVIPYFSSSSDSTIYGVAGGKSSVWGQNVNMLGRYQFGTGNHEGSLLIRDEYFLNSRWILGVSFDYEEALHRIYRGREVIQRTNNATHGGSIQTGFHVRPSFAIGFNTYIERHRFEEPRGEYHSDMQISHRLLLTLGNFYVDEGLSRGEMVRPYFETTGPWSGFQFQKYGAQASYSAYLNGNFNWLIRPSFEVGLKLPRYQLFELGGAKLRGFPVQEFRDRAYVTVQQDAYLTAWDLWKLIVRPLAYADWAFVEGEGRTSLGGGFHVFFKSVAVPALQVVIGYGFNPGGLAAAATIGPQF